MAPQAPLSMEFSKQEYWSGLPFPPAGDLPDPGIKPMSPVLAGRFFTTEPPGKPKSDIKNNFSYKFATSRIKVHSLYYRKKLNSI